jgi:hypothetical protein
VSPYTHEEPQYYYFLIIDVIFHYLLMAHCANMLALTYIRNSIHHIGEGDPTRWSTYIILEKETLQGGLRF